MQDVSTSFRKMLVSYPTIKNKRKMLYKHRFKYALLKNYNKEDLCSSILMTSVNAVFVRTEFEIQLT